MIWKSTLLVTLLIAAVLSASDRQSTPTPESGEVSQGGRRIRFVPGAPLTAQLRPTDKILTIESDSPPPLMVEPPPEMTLVEWRTRRADLVAVVTIVNKSSAVRPAGDWVMTRVTASVIEVLKNVNERTLAPSDVITYTEPGGEVGIGNQTVRAQIHWSKPFLEGRTYLIFGVWNEAGELITGALSSYELDGRRLRAQLSLPKWPKDEIERSADVDEVLAEIRVQANAPSLRRKQP